MKRTLRNVYILKAKWALRPFDVAALHYTLFFLNRLYSLTFKSLKVFDKERGRQHYIQMFIITIVRN